MARFGMPLMQVSGIDDENVTLLFATGLMTVEDPDSYIWFMNRMRDAVGDEAWGRVRTVATDGGVSFNSSLSTCLPEVCMCVEKPCSFEGRRRISGAGGTF